MTSCFHRGCSVAPCVIHHFLYFLPNSHVALQQFHLFDAFCCVRKGSTTCLLCPAMGVYQPNWLWCLNWCCSGFPEPRCYIENQSVFPPVLCRILMIKEMSSTEGVAQYTGTCKTCHAHFPSQGKHAIFRFYLGTNFLGSEPI